MSKVKRTTLTNLSASFTASKMRINMLATGDYQSPRWHDGKHVSADGRRFGKPQYP
ncbi:hypothetical protein Q2941_25970 [Bradyrhizobium sp. UFLA05-153]